MNKVLWIAWREFIATVTTKGFIIGILITPVMIGLMIVILPILINEKPPKIEGEIAVIDPTGEVSAGVEEYLSREAIASRWGDRKEKIQERIDEEIPEAARKLVAGTGNEDAAAAALEAVLGEVPTLHVNALGDPDVEAAKQPLLVGEAQDGGRLAVVVVHPDAVSKPPGQEQYGGYDLFVRGKLDDRLQDEVKDATRQAIIDSRVRIAGLDRKEIDALTRVKRVRSTTVTAEGEQETNELLNILIPAGFMVLLLVAVITGGQQLLTTTVEEKSSRVVEVLLSAVSPMQLMTGKILGQLCAGMVILVLYSAMGVAALISFAFLGLLDPWLLFYLVIFYLIAYFTYGSMMAAIGSAVNEMSEAQTLMTPVMLMMMIPWLLWMPITRDPNSAFATITSFVPPINTFVMLLRMSSTTPPPLWQVWLSILVGVAGVYGALWAAAKVFRVGVLMFGKAPSFATLVRWIRMA